LANVDGFYSVTKDLPLVRVGELMFVRDEAIVGNGYVFVHVVNTAEGIHDVLWSSGACTVQFALSLHVSQHFRVLYVLGLVLALWLQIGENHAGILMVV